MSASTTRLEQMRTLPKRAALDALEGKVAAAQAVIDAATSESRITKQQIREFGKLYDRASAYYQQYSKVLGFLVNEGRGDGEADIAAVLTVGENIGRILRKAAKVSSTGAMLLLTDDELKRRISNLERTVAAWRDGSRCVVQDFSNSVGYRDSCLGMIEMYTRIMAIKPVWDVLEWEASDPVASIPIDWLYAHLNGRTFSFGLIKCILLILLHPFRRGRNDLGLINVEMVTMADLTDVLNTIADQSFRNVLDQCKIFKGLCRLLKDCDARDPKAIGIWKEFSRQSESSSVVGEMSERLEIYPNDPEPSTLSPQEELPDDDPDLYSGVGTGTVGLNGPKRQSH